MKIILKYLVATGIIGYLLYKVPVSSIWAAISAAKWEFLLFAGLCAFLVQWTTADRLRRLLKVSNNLISTWEIFKINLSTLFYGLFLPGGNLTGIAIRFYRLSEEKQDPVATGIALFTERIISTVMLLLVGIVFWLPDRPDEGWISFLVMAVLVVGLILTMAVVLAAERIRLVKPLFLMLQHCGGIASRIHEALYKQAKLSVKGVFEISILSLITHLLGIVAYWLIALSLGIEIGLVTMGWVRSSIILVTMIPLTPSGIGLREGASLLLLMQMGMNEGKALAFSLIVFGITILVVGLVGGVVEVQRLWRK